MPIVPGSRGARNQQVARAGEHFVVAEFNKRGAHAVTFAGNMPHIDLMACDQAQGRTVHIQVKTKSGGRTWHAGSSAVLEDRITIALRYFDKTSTQGPG